MPISEGAQRIVQERQRHFDVEGWTIQGDVENYTKGELVLAAISYAAVPLVRELGISITQITSKLMMHPASTWPETWDKKKWDKRGRHSVIRCLEIAGSLIAAEIDRRLALGEEE